MERSSLIYVQCSITRRAKLSEAHEVQDEKVSRPAFCVWLCVRALGHDAAQHCRGIDRIGYGPRFLSGPPVQHAKMARALGSRVVWLGSRQSFLAFSIYRT